jgi:hypothetical protein
VVFVESKVAAETAGSWAVAPQIDGVPTDVVEVGEVRACVFTQRHRPAPCGSSVGHVGVTAGTMGCLCVLESNNRLCMLSNNHVLANVNNAQRGAPIVQPGVRDFGRMPNDRIAVLEDFVPINFAGRNAVDAAVAWTSVDNGLVVASHHTFTMNPQPAVARQQMSVRKCGRTTGDTLGFVRAMAADVNVQYGNLTAQFVNQIVVQGFAGAFSDPGDSGSIVVEALDKRPIGLLFAGGRGFTFVNPMETVMSALGIRELVAK